LARSLTPIWKSDWNTSKIFREWSVDPNISDIY
jgi:hypothetical protein